MGSRYSRVLLLAVAMCTFAHAAYANNSPTVVCWSVGLLIGAGISDTYSSGGFGVLRPEASDGYDRWDTLLVPGPRAYFGTYHTMGVDGWEGPTGFYQSDWRVPYGELGQSKTWRFYVWADPLLPAEATIIGVNLGSNGVDGLRVTLTLRDKPSVVVGGPVSGTTWTLPPFGRRVDLPVYRTDNGLEGYVFDLTATVVPEPSSLLALSAGLAGLAGARRRAGAG